MPLVVNNLSYCIIRCYPIISDTRYGKIMSQRMSKYAAYRLPYYPKPAPYPSFGRQGDTMSASPLDREWFCLPELADEEHWNFHAVVQQAQAGRLLVYIPTGPRAAPWHGRCEGGKLEPLPSVRARVPHDELPLNMRTAELGFPITRVLIPGGPQGADQEWVLEPHPSIKLGELQVPHAEASSFIAWASNKMGQPFLDTTHPHYSLELATAVRAWLTLFSETDNSLPRKRTPKAQIRGWLKIHARELSAGAQERIAALVNPVKAKSGGAPRSDSK